MGKGVRGGAQGHPLTKHPNKRQSKGFDSPLNVDKYHLALSLQDEARNTERQHIWNPDLKLRHARVTFVSVGHSDQHGSTGSVQESNDAELPKHLSTNHEIPHDVSMAALSLEDSHPPPIGFTSISKGKAQNEFLHSNEMEHEEHTKSENDIFFTDLNGAQQPTHTGLPKLTVRRSPSPSQSDSSEEVIIFSGRKRVEFDPNSSFASIPILPLNQNSQQMTSVRQFNTPQSLQTIAMDDPVSNISSALPLSRAVNLQSAVELDYNRAPVSYSVKPKKKKKPCKAGQNSDLRAEALTDYITNVKNSEDDENLAGGTLLPTCRFEITENSALLNELYAPSSENCEKVLPEQINGWDSSNLHDLDNLSTSSDDLIVVRQVLSKRRRRSGIQYLVVGENQSVNEARWMTLNSLRMPSASEQVRVYETKHFGAHEHSLSTNGSDDAYGDKRNAGPDFQDELDDIEDEQDLLDFTIAQMTDERIARLLSKQEELDLGLDDIVLFDGDEFENGDQFTASLENRHGHLFRSRHKKTNETQNKTSSIPAIENEIEVAPYNGFDVVDRNRPCLRKSPKGYRGMLALEPSDSDIGKSMQASWEYNRSKKKVQKQEREKLRKLGLIGKKSKATIKVRCVDDVSIAKLKEEIKDFLKSPADRLPLPPMGQQDRKNIHQIANILNLKSKSIGSGKSRYPVLYKTARIASYNSAVIDAVFSQTSTRRFMKRRDQSKSKNPTAMRNSRGGGFNAAVSYRDGEIVGAAAPELGQENKGRAMLERMGWSTGTALGASNNKGIMQPLAHVVKTTKAGLG